MVLDTEIAAMLPTEAPAPTCFDWDAIERMTNCSRERYFARLAEMHLVQGERLAAGYIATENRGRVTRHLGYSEGAVKPPVRETSMQRCAREARVLNIHV